MEELVVKRNSLFQKMKWELETAKKVMTRHPPHCEVRERADRLHRLGDDFFGVQGEIEDQITDLETIASVFNYRSEFEEMYYHAKAIYIQMDDESTVVGDDANTESKNHLQSAVTALLEAQRVLLSNQAVVSTQTSALTTQLERFRLHPASSRDEQGQNMEQQLNVRLPPINIPTFNGNRKEWRSFKDLFVSTIHTKETLRNSQKLQYLLSYLDGEAKTLVSSFAITDANYTQVWEKLLERYDQNKYTVFALVKEFLDQSPVSSANPISLRKLVTTSDEVIRQLSAMGTEYESCDPWLIQLLLEKIDMESRNQWAAKLVDLQNPTLRQFLKFLEDRCDALETCSSFTRSVAMNAEAMKKETRKDQANPSEKKFQSFYVAPQQCPKCYSVHQIYQCELFKALSVADRRELVQQSKLCFNCLRPSHSVKSCPSKSSCKGCDQRHHSLLCQQGDSQAATPVQKPTILSAHSSPATELPVQEVHSTYEVSSFKADVSPAEPPTKVAVLPTALIKIRGRSGSFQTARAMIDSCSGASLISEACATRLGLNRTNARFAVTGVAGSAAGTTKGVVRLEMSSRFNDEVILTTQAYVLDVLTSPVPSQTIDVKRMKFLEAIPLADPDFWKAGEIDVILGVELFLPMLLAGQVNDEDGMPIAQNTVFGWLVAGRFEGGTSIQTLCASLTMDAVDLNINIDKSLRTEEISSQKVLSADETKAAEIFKNTNRRDNKTKPALGKSLTAAVKRFYAVERKVLANPTFKQQVRIAEDQVDYLRVVFRNNPENPIQHYRLKTVTYGTSCTAYLATESLRPAQIVPIRLVCLTLAVVNRFVGNLKAVRNKQERETEPINPAELQTATLQVVRLAEHGTFAKELTCLRNGTDLPRTSENRSLLSTDGVGTLQMKHPTVVRRAVQNSLRCCRMNAKTATQLMGGLPAVRTMPVRTFVHVGIIYAGRVRVCPYHSRPPNRHGVVTTVTLRRGSSEYQRPIRELVPLLST